MVSSQNKMVLSEGKFSDPNGRQELKDAFDHLAASRKNTLVIHFHGGLVDLPSAENSAEQLLSSYEAAGGYPLFVMWQSGLLNTIQEILNQASDEQLFQILVADVSHFVLGKLDQTNGQEGPTIQQVSGEISAKQTVNEIPYQNRDAEAKGLGASLIPSNAEIGQFTQQLTGNSDYIQAMLALIRPNPPKMNSSLFTDLQSAIQVAASGVINLILTAPGATSAAVRILCHVTDRISSGRDHGIYTTVVEEVLRELKGDQIGKDLWDEMKTSTEAAFNGSSDTYGGTALLEEIKRVINPGMRVVLVGHSAGAVYICNFLKKAAEMLEGNNFHSEVVFLAPACSFKQFNEALTAAGCLIEDPEAQTETSSLITSFRSFGMQDALEIQDAIASPIYDSSLLYFVSGLLEDQPDMPLVGMQRYPSQNKTYTPKQFPEVSNVLNFAKKFPNPWIWSKTDDGAEAGETTRSCHHGGFEMDCETRISVAYLIAPPAQRSSLIPVIKQACEDEDHTCVEQTEPVGNTGGRL